MVGGRMPIDEVARHMGVSPCWTGYVAVDDVDDYAKRVEKAGGAVHRGPEAIPGVGRFAVVADPHGAVFIIMKGSSADGPKDPAPGTPAQLGSREPHGGASN